MVILLVSAATSSLKVNQLLKIIQRTPSPLATGPEHHSPHRTVAEGPSAGPSAAKTPQNAPEGPFLGPSATLAAYFQAKYYLSLLDPTMLEGINNTTFFSTMLISIVI